MLGHTKTHLTEKDVIKAKIKEDLSVFKKIYLKTFDTEDLSFIKELQDEFEDLLHHTSSEIISAEKTLKNLTDRYGKAGALLKGIRAREGLTQIWLKVGGIKVLNDFMKQEVPLEFNRIMQKFFVFC